MDGPRVRLCNAGTRRGPRGRPGLRVAPGQRGRAAVALARRLRGRRGRGGRGGRSSTSRSPRAPSSTGTAAGRPNRARSRSRPGRSVADLRREHAPPDGAAPARVLRGRRAPPALHARRRGALRHPAGALAADPAAGGGARARAAAPDLAGRRADRGGRGSARARRGGAGRGRRGAGGHGSPHRGRRAAWCGSRRPRPTRRGCPRRSRTSTAITRGSRSGCGRARAAEVVALVQAGTVDVAVLALTDEPRRRRRSTRSPTSRCGSRCRSTTSSAGTHGAVCDALRGRPFILAEPGTRPARHRDERRSGRRLQPAAAVRGRRPGDGALPRARGAGDQPRAGELARAAGADRRRGGPSRSTAPPAPAAHARRGDLTGRQAPARAPARALARGACAGREPTSVWTGAPSWKSMNVGIESTPYWAATRLVVVDVELDDPEVVAARRRSRRGSGSSRGRAGTTRR